MSGWRRPVDALRRSGRDVLTLARAGRTLWCRLRAQEPVDAGLGTLSAASTRVTRGHRERYALSIANARGEPRELIVRLDIHAVGTARGPAAHCARMTWRLAVDPRSLRRVEIDYDWWIAARLVVDGADWAPDAEWRGAAVPGALCTMRVALDDGGGRELDRLTIYQEVSG